LKDILRTLKETAYKIISGIIIRLAIAKPMLKTRSIESKPVKRNSLPLISEPRRCNLSSPPLKACNKIKSEDIITKKYIIGL
jgi:hypothetical protein